MSLVELAAFKAAITVDDAVDDVDLQRSLDAASQWIENYCGQTFELPAPAAVEQACIILANRYFHRLNTPFGVLESAQLGGFASVPAEDPDVVALLAPYAATGSSGSTWVAV